MKVLLTLSTVWLASVAAVNYQCTSCLQRAAFDVKAIVHGTRDDQAWEQIRAAAIRSASDMKVNLEWNSQERFSPEELIQDILAVIESAEKPDALLVSIPTEEVAEAVRQVVDARIPVIALNAGAPFVDAAGVINYVGPDEKMGGIRAAEALRDLGVDKKIVSKGNKQTIIKPTILYVNEQVDNIVATERKDGLIEAYGEDASIIELKVPAADPDMIELILKERLLDSPVDAVILSGNRAVQPAIRAFEEAQISIASVPLGSFDATEVSYNAVRDLQLSFLISNQQFLQGSVASILASLVGTTGKSPVMQRENSIQPLLTGPLLIRSDNVPSIQEAACEVAAYPKSCVDPSSIKIGAITSGFGRGEQWDPIHAAFRQAAQDIGVQLISRRFDLYEVPEQVAEEWPEQLVLEMAMGIEELRDVEVVDALVLNIPSNHEYLQQAIQEWKHPLLNKPILSIGDKEAVSVQLGFENHIGTIDRDLGASIANELLAENPSLRYAVGVRQPGVEEALFVGFAEAMEASGVETIALNVPDTQSAAFIQKIEAGVKNAVPLIGEDWENIALFVPGIIQEVPRLQLQALHPKALAASRDVAKTLIPSLKAGVREIGVDQGAYLQGYLSVALLSIEAISRQKLSSRVVNSGPVYIESIPSRDQQVCEAIDFQAC